MLNPLVWIVVAVVVAVGYGRARPVVQAAWAAGVAAITFAMFLAGSPGGLYGSQQATSIVAAAIVAGLLTWGIAALFERRRRRSTAASEE